MHNAKFIMHNHSSYSSLSGSRFLYWFLSSFEEGEGCGVGEED